MQPPFLFFLILFLPLPTQSCFWHFCLEANVMFILEFFILNQTFKISYLQPSFSFFLISFLPLPTQSCFWHFCSEADVMFILKIFILNQTSKIFFQCPVVQNLDMINWHEMRLWKEYFDLTCDSWEFKIMNTDNLWTFLLKLFKYAERKSIYGTVNCIWTLDFMLYSLVWEEIILVQKLAPHFLLMTNFWTCPVFFLPNLY